MLKVIENNLSGYISKNHIPLLVVMAKDENDKKGIWLGRAGYHDMKTKTYDEKHEDVTFLSHNLNIYDYIVEPEGIHQADRTTKEEFKKINAMLKKNGTCQKGIAMEKETTWIRFHEKFVKEGIERKEDGKTFNIITLPKGTVINGTEVGGYQFSPLFIHDDNYNANYKAVPLLTDREVQLRKIQRDENRNPIKNAEGKTVYDVVTVMPEQIKEALAENYRKFKEAAKEKAETEKESHTNKVNIEPEKSEPEQQIEEELER